MIVDAIHRARTQTHSIETYEKLVEACVRCWSTIPGISSIVVCGSVVKNDIVPGWSDIDIVLFIAGANHYWTMSSVRNTMAELTRQATIGLGVDLVDEGQFKVTNRLGGRPLGMTYEVAKCGQVRYGKNYLASVVLDETTRRRIDIEREACVLAELHNWRRAFIALQPSEVGSKPWAARCVKTMLKLLKYETDPSIEPPFTHLGALQRLERTFPGRSSQVFRTAVELRSKWSTLQWDEMSLEVKNIEEALVSYRSMTR